MNEWSGQTHTAVLGNMAHSETLMTSSGLKSNCTCPLTFSKPHHIHLMWEQLLQCVRAMILPFFLCPCTCVLKDMVSYCYYLFTASVRTKAKSNIWTVSSCKNPTDEVLSFRLCNVVIVAVVIFSLSLGLCASVFLTALLEVDGAKMFPFSPLRDLDLFNNFLALTS